MCNDVSCLKSLTWLTLDNKAMTHLCSRFLNDVQSYSSVNKMSIQNLATVFGPNILRPKAEDPESIIGGEKYLGHHK